MVAKVKSGAKAKSKAKVKSKAKAKSKAMIKQGINVSSKDGNCKVLIVEDMTIYEVAKQKAELLKALDKNQLMEIDLSSVNEMDTAGLQVLLLIKQTAEKAKKVMLLVAHSPATLDVIDRYNLAAYFGDPVVISSAGN